MRRSRLFWLGLVLVLGGSGFLVLGSAIDLAAAPELAQGVPFTGPGPVMGQGPRTGPGPMMGQGPRTGPGSGQGPSSPAGPGTPGFVAGTAGSPRVVRIVATPQLRFIPDVVQVKAGETISFEVTSLGMVAHEFMVGPAADLAADKQGTPEIADIGMMQTKSLSYTFDGAGPFAYACHVTGHYEAGMRGTIVIVP